MFTTSCTIFLFAASLSESIAAPPNILSKENTQGADSVCNYGCKAIVCLIRARVTAAPDGNFPFRLLDAS